MDLTRESWSEDPLFVALLALEGTAYEAAKTRVLEQPGLAAAYAERYAGAPEWRARAMASTLLGWLTHGAAYTSFVADLLAVDFEAESQTIVAHMGPWSDFAGRAKVEFGADAFPLCWEIILKHERDLDWRQTGACVWALAHMPDARSNDVLLDLAGRTSNAMLAEYALRALDPRDERLVERLAANAERSANHARLAQIMIKELGRRHA